MMRTILCISWLRLKRDIGALALTFVLPLVFFSIFAAIFSGMGTGGGGGGGSAIVVLIADDDDTETSRRFIDALADHASLSVRRAPGATEKTPSPDPYDAETATRLVRLGHADVALVIPAGFGEEFGSFAGDTTAVQLVYDRANPMAAPTVSGLLQAAAMTAAPDLLMEKGLGQLEQAGGFLTETQRDLIDQFRPFLRGEQPWSDFDPDGDGDGDGEAAGDADPAADDGVAQGMAGLVQVEQIDARAGESDEDTQPSMVAYYAAGIGVMFLLFSMAGASGTLLEEEEDGTLERVLTSNVGMGRLLMGNWLFFSIIGIVQVTLMFLFGWLVFEPELMSGHRAFGFIAMTLPTATAAAAFGLILAALCRSRAQLSGLSTIVILVMSALGGSMVPRFVMPDFMNTTALFTFNGWALDGYLKVFWYDDPDATLLQSLTSLIPQVAVLSGGTVVFMLIARWLARRWEVV